MSDEYIEHWLTVLADEFSLYLYRTDDGKWCVSPDGYMSDRRYDPHKGHGVWVHHDGSPDASDLHRNTIREAIDARRAHLTSVQQGALHRVETDAARAKRTLVTLGVGDDA